MGCNKAWWLSNGSRWILFVPGGVNFKIIRIWMPMFTGSEDNMWKCGILGVGIWAHIHIRETIAERQGDLISFVGSNGMGATFHVVPVIDRNTIGNQLVGRVNGFVSWNFRVIVHNDNNVTIVGPNQRTCRNQWDMGHFMVVNATQVTEFSGVFNGACIRTRHSSVGATINESTMVRA